MVQKVNMKDGNLHESAFIYSDEEPLMVLLLLSDLGYYYHITSDVMRYGIIIFALRPTGFGSRRDHLKAPGPCL